MKQWLKSQYTRQLSCDKALVRGERRGAMIPEQQHDPVPELTELPAPTPWPMITAFGITLLCTGLVTHVAVSVVGLILALRGAVGWFREDLPVERHEPVPMRPVGQRAQLVKASPRPV